MTSRSIASLKWLAGSIGLYTDYDNPPAGLRWRSNTVFICTTVGVGMAVDVFLYSLIVPVIPFILEERIGVSQDQLQSITSGLLTAYAAPSVLCSPIAGFIADRTSTRQAPFLSGLAALLVATVILYVAQSVPVLIFARIMQGVSGAVVWTVGLALALDTVGPANLGKVIGTIFSFVSLASLMGPVIGGAIYEKFGYGGVFAVGAAFLLMDFLMRIIVIEKRVAARYKTYSPVPDPRSNGNDGDWEENETSEADRQGQGEPDGDEETPLLPKEQDDFTVKQKQSTILKHMPIFYCFRNPSLVVAILITFAQSLLLGIFDSTVPTEAKDLFGFNSLQAGLLFIPLGISDLLTGPIWGWAVDKFGAKPIGFLSFAWACPTLVALRAVQAGGKSQIILYSVLLALNGIGLSGTGAPSVVESGAVVEKYHKANPGLFGDNGPYAQLYGFSSMMFSGGLALGPILAGSLRESIGYGNMNLVAGVICAIAALACLFVLGGPLRWPKWRR